MRQRQAGRHPTEAHAQGACLHGTVRPVLGRRASKGGEVAFAAAVHPGTRRNGRRAVVVMHCCRHHLASVARRVRDRALEEDVHAGALGYNVEAAFDRLRIVKGRDTTEAHPFHDTPDGPQFGQELLRDAEHHLPRVFRLRIQAAVSGDALHGGRSAQAAERLEQRGTGASLGGTDRSGRSGGPAADDGHVIHVSA